MIKNISQLLYNIIWYIIKKKFKDNDNLAIFIINL